MRLTFAFKRGAVLRAGASVDYATRLFHGNGRRIGLAAYGEASFATANFSFVTAETATLHRSG
jgi:hypothetical protein